MSSRSLREDAERRSDIDFEGGGRRQSLMQGGDGKMRAYASRKAIQYDDDASQCSDPDEPAPADDAQDEDLKPNLQFENYRFQFDSLLKHKQVPTQYPIVSCMISYDSSRAILVSKRDDREFWVRMYDLESYEKTFEEKIGGREESYIRAKEVE